MDTNKNTNLQGYKSKIRYNWDACPDSYTNVLFSLRTSIWLAGWAGAGWLAGWMTGGLAGCWLAGLADMTGWLAGRGRGARWLDWEIMVLNKMCWNILSKAMCFKLLVSQFHETNCKQFAILNERCWNFPKHIAIMKGASKIHEEVTTVNGVC